VVANTVFPNMRIKYAIYFGVNIQKDVSVTEKRSEFLLNLFQKVKLGVEMSLA
jgi:hypothetical protein